jgi:hypothetical protein
LTPGPERATGLREPVAVAAERAGRAGEGLVTRGAWPPGETTGRSSRSCSRAQIGQFWISRLWRQKLGTGSMPSLVQRYWLPIHETTGRGLVLSVLAGAGDELAEAPEAEDEHEGREAQA